ncbi:MFS transporter, FSR family, fosmidomycin resistance protein [Modicisalibacter muralis]|uniref:MFS transporter, FSR family, fosmidomycin resistance protein n=1 Tax=Modicisalibacter muralis TaxID=119000 RepID=A0A1G9LQW1_9GAMM|nr:MFS transporter [Halomonas muralis]SDL64157.1 MFS transporter, FSR family, fosmidomycin resistance protein [Halomonas muralis]
MKTVQPQQAVAANTAGTTTSFKVLGGISVAHMMNDMIQSVLLAIYPMLKGTFDLSFAQIGLITLTYQLAASLLQPWVGLYTDKRPLPFSLAIGMGFTLTGLLLLSVAPSYLYLLLAAVLVGTGSSIFHPEASRVARMASGNRHGLAQSLFQVGGNVGSALGPLLAALLIIPHGQGSVAWFSLAALIGMVVLFQIGRWYAGNQALLTRKPRKGVDLAVLSRRRVLITLGLLGMLIFSKYFYLASLSSYFTFYLIERFALSVQSAQLYLFLFLASVAVGTVAGGPIGDRIGRKVVIWGSILGVAPFTLLLPHADLFWTGVLVVIIGLVLASAFSAIVVYAQELVPGRVGLIAGLFFGFAFGMGGIGAAVLGYLADTTSIVFVYQLCAFLPLLGIVALWLPDLERRTRQATPVTEPSTE